MEKYNLSLTRGDLMMKAGLPAKSYRLKRLQAGIKIIIYTGLIVIASFVLVKARAQETEVDIKSGEKVIDVFTSSGIATDSPTILKVDETPTLKLNQGSTGAYQAENVYISSVYDADASFNAIGAHWYFDAPTGTSAKVYLRVSDGTVWSTWQMLQTQDLVGRDDKTGKLANQASGEEYSDLVFAEGGKQFQYKVVLRTTNAKLTPTLDKIDFTYIDSTQGPVAAEFQKGWFAKAFASDVEIAGAPTIISRTAWGCPEKETSPRWAPETASKSYQVYHHTVTTNGAEPYGVMRAIWYYQANTRGWGDIGYNYLVDQYGHIFKGRNGGSSVIGAHVYGHNTHSIGVAVLGTYVSSSPSAAATSALSSILAYNAYLNGSSIKLYGHRQLDSTQCPGDSFYAKKAVITAQAVSKLEQYRVIYKYNNTYYYPESNVLYEIPTTDIALNYGFSLASAKTLTQAQFETFTLSPSKLDYFIKDASRVYIATGGKLKPVDGDFLLSRWGINKDNVFQSDFLVSKIAKGEKITYLARSFSQQLNYYLPGNGIKRIVTTRVLAQRGYYSGDAERVPYVATGLLNKYKTFGYLSYLNGVYPKPVVRYQDKLYYHETNYLRLIPTADILTNWGFDSSDIRDISTDEFNSYLLAKDLDYFSRNETQSYIAVGGHLRKIETGYLQTRFGVTFLEVTKNRLLVNYRPKIAPVSYLARSYSSGVVYYFDALGRKVVVKSVLQNRGLYRGIPQRVPHIPTTLINRYAQIGYLPYKDGTLIKGEHSSTIYLVSGGEKCYVSAYVFASWKYPVTKVLIVNGSMLGVIPTGDSWPAKKVPSIIGPGGKAISLPAYAGKTAREQHLWLSSSESEAHHYSTSSTPSDCQNGMAGGYGAFGSAATISQERYYINMRWLYCTWYEDGDGVTRTKDCDDVLKAWHRHKRLIVTNPANGKSVVVAIEESGPAIWTGRVSGLSPEAMKAIGASTNDSLTYYWAGLQSLPLGPIN